MRSRRAFLMTAISAAAVGGVALITTLLGQGRSRARTAPQTTAPTAPSSPGGQNEIIPRADWGALPADVRPEGSGENGPYDAIHNPNGWLVYTTPLAEVLAGFIMHHSALPLSDGPREIQRLHMEERGFADVGYHFLIDETGRIFEGRPLDVRGAHAFGCNYGTVGICLIGNFEEIDPTPVQLAALDGLLDSLVSQYPALHSLAGHKDCNPGVTLCPGARFFPRLPEIAQAHGLTYGL